MPILKLVSLGFPNEIFPFYQLITQC